MHRLRWTVSSTRRARVARRRRAGLARGSVGSAGCGEPRRESGTSGGTTSGLGTTSGRVRRPTLRRAVPATARRRSRSCPSCSTTEHRPEPVTVGSDAGREPQLAQHVGLGRADLPVAEGAVGLEPGSREEVRRRAVAGSGIHTRNEVAPEPRAVSTAALTMPRAVTLLAGAPGAPRGRAARRRPRRSPGRHWGRGPPSRRSAPPAQATSSRWRRVGGVHEGLAPHAGERRRLEVLERVGGHQVAVRHHPNGGLDHPDRRRGPPDGRDGRWRRPPGRALRECACDGRRGRSLSIQAPRVYEGAGEPRPPAPRPARVRGRCRRGRRRLLLAGCAGPAPGADSPEAAVTTFFHDLGDKDAEGACRGRLERRQAAGRGAVPAVHPRFQKMLGSLSDQQDIASLRNAQVSGARVEGDRATVLQSQITDLPAVVRHGHRPGPDRRALVHRLEERARRLRRWHDVRPVVRPDRLTSRGTLAP